MRAVKSFLIPRFYYLLPLTSLSYNASMRIIKPVMPIISNSLNFARSHFTITQVKQSEKNFTVYAIGGNDNCTFEVYNS